MARHTAERSGARTPASVPSDPTPGSRRALRTTRDHPTEALPLGQVHRAPAAAAAPTRASGATLKAVRAGMLGVVVVSTGAFTLTQVAAEPADPGDVAVAESGTLALRAGDVASRSEIAGRLALEADGARTFTVAVDGEEREITTTAATLAEALDEAGIVLGADDRVSAPISGAVPAGETVEVTRVTSETVTEETVEPFATVEKDDPTLPEGEREVETEGVEGVSTSTFEILRAGDEELSRTLLASVIASVKVDEVVRVGTKAPEPEPTPAPAAAASSAPAPAPAAATYSGDPRALGRELAAARGWGADQFSCLDALWTKESNWNPLAKNPSSGAYGIPQSLPASKMATVGADYLTNPATQITWGLNYIGDRYGTPCAAWSQSQAVNWY
ncbi:G5 domain-containing protein [Georgenia muralis]|uniref:Transglycosylase-like protein with SLT domain n=1 Tax=Georgenia muralis TaxID=154117 RepID=A0A3N4ZKD8_9MICO|nr:G5 domain-containing protein [Georgenia muralis]RPF26112.1 transglycosylase-like protein with SLT domain [Georgenia muralis]